jgi:8-oxo-dGTP pyrophosphatase MutT (NUDIX family)
MRLLKRLFFWICWLGLYLYFYRSQRTRAIIMQGSNTLLVKGWWGRLFDDMGWELPGGGLHRGEKPATGLIRELHEELGLEIQPNQLKPLGMALMQDHGIGYKAHYFLIELEEKPELELAKLEIVKTMWADLQQDELQDQLKSEVTQGLQLLGKQ